MPKIEFSMNQLGLILKTVRMGKEKARRQITYKAGDFEEFLYIEDKIIDMAFKEAKKSKP